MFFIARAKSRPGRLATCFGPYNTREAAVGALEQFALPGDYEIFGPAEFVAAATIDAPKVTMKVTE